MTVEGEGFENVRPGDVVHVKSKAGKEWDATISEVLELTPWGAKCRVRIGKPAPAPAPAPEPVGDIAFDPGDDGGEADAA